MLLAALVAALAIAGPQPTSAEDAGGTFGKDLDGAQEVKVAELVARPDEYLGKTVRIQGVVVEVCGKDGTWMDIANDAEGPKIRIKIEDGATVFPIEAKGKQVIAEGVFAKIKKTPEEAKASTESMADAASLTLDAKDAAESRGATYEIRASGAGIKI